MEEILHQLIGSLSHYLQGLYIPGGSGFLPSTVVVSQIWFISNPNPWGVKMIQFGRLLILCHPRVASTTTREMKRGSFGSAKTALPVVEDKQMWLLVALVRFGSLYMYIIFTFIYIYIRVKPVFIDRLMLIQIESIYVYRVCIYGYWIECRYTLFICLIIYYRL